MKYLFFLLFLIFNTALSEINNIEDETIKSEKEIDLTTIINFNESKKSSINIKATNINNEKFNITKLELCEYITNHYKETLKIISLVPDFPTA